MKPQVIEFHGRLYELIQKKLEPKKIHHLPNWKISGPKNPTKGNWADDFTLITSCGKSIDKLESEGDIRPENATCTTCRKVLGLPPYQYPKVVLHEPAWIADDD